MRPLLITFSGFAGGQPRLGQPALGGLFSTEQCPHLEQAELDNRSLYQALFKIGFFESNRVLVRINYRDMDTEELGSVYESLLELVPQLAVNGRWNFGFVGDEEDRADTSGHARKLTGSYYTPDALVQELISSALVPVIEKRLQRHSSNPRNVLLNIAVCDPACGSGHFLLAAARRLAAELARIDAGADQPTEIDYRRALREVVRHCIYGVDMNPLAVELCKTALWLETLEPGKPLGFLDAHIQIGNSLIGLLTPDLLADGIPDEAYKALTGDDKATVSALKRRNKIDKQQRELLAAHVPDLKVCAGSVAAMPEDSLADVEEKRYAWQVLVNSQSCQDEKLRADVFTAAFFAAKTSDDAERVPTNLDLAVLEQGEQIDPKVREYVTALATANRFFHWYLAFPEVFERGGFDVMLGNPPWDVSQLSEEEYFISRVPRIAALKGAKRKFAINGLHKEERHIWEKYQVDKRDTEARNQFFRTGKRFNLTAGGKINLYALFAEHMIQVMRHNGRAGVIVPTGVATDHSTKDFFVHLIVNHLLISLYDFENRDAIFPDVHRSYKFCLLTLVTSINKAEFAFFLVNCHILKKNIAVSV